MLSLLPRDALTRVSEAELDAHYRSAVARAMKRLNVPPTHNALLAMKRQVRFLEQGHDMLEKKRELLTRVVHARLAEYRALRQETEQALAEAYRWLAICQMRMGSLMLRQASLGLAPAVEVTIVPRSSVGVEYPSVTARARCRCNRWG